ncbi:hypothetical protein YC2023_072932 [Brassica napus]
MVKILQRPSGSSYLYSSGGIYDSNNNGGVVGDYDEDDGGNTVDGKSNVEDSSPTVNQTVRIKKFIHHGAFTWDTAKVKVHPQ